MICWRCGIEMPENSIKCPECGAQRPKARRSASVPEDTTVYARPEPVETRTRSRRANASRAEVAPAPQAEKKSRSMPPSGRRSKRTKETRPPMPPRMVKRHEYSAITPQTQGYDHVNWLRLCTIAGICVVILVAGIYLFLDKTGPGQQLLAQNGFEASADAYHELGKTYMIDGAVIKAVWAMEIAQTKEPDDLEILLDLGKAYTANNQLDRAEIAFSRAIQFWPNYPEPYRLLIESMLEQKRNYEALQLAEIAIEKNGDSYFELMYNKLLPITPTFSEIGGRYTKPMNLEIQAEEGATIYYTVKGEDPIEKGRKYNSPIYLVEGAWRVCAVAYKDGMYSKLQEQSYVINKPSPDMPRASLGPGSYTYPQKVSLRAGEDVVAIYYTTDGTAPSEKSKVYTEPIPLRIGWTTIRAIAMNAENKFSNEYTVEYKCEGKSKDSMSDKDTVGGHKLFSTTREAFEKSHGAPLSEHPDGQDPLGTYTKLVYAFGYAVFLDRGNDKAPVLVELSTNSTAFSGPRRTGIGSRMSDVLGAYRDEGGEENAKGDRLLYTLTSGRMGMLTKLAENEYNISYYCKLDNGQYIELTYHITDELVDRITWLQYESAST